MVALLFVLLLWKADCWVICWWSCWNLCAVINTAIIFSAVCWDWMSRSICLRRSQVRNAMERLKIAVVYELVFFISEVTDCHCCMHSTLIIFEPRNKLYLTSIMKVLWIYAKQPQIKDAQNHSEMWSTEHEIVVMQCCKLIPMLSPYSLSWASLVDQAKSIASTLCQTETVCMFNSSRT